VNQYFPLFRKAAVLAALVGCLVFMVSQPAAAETCEQCWNNWSACNDNCFEPEVCGVPRDEECFQQCQWSCYDRLYRCYDTCSP
jgi:hypothetical protein